MKFERLDLRARQANVSINEAWTGDFPYQHCQNNNKAELGQSWNAFLSDHCLAEGLSHLKINGAQVCNREDH